MMQKMKPISNNFLSISSVNIPLIIWHREHHFACEYQQTALSELAKEQNLAKLGQSGRYCSLITNTDIY